MKVTLNYNLPEEQVEYNYAMNGIGYAMVLEDVDNWLRSLYKYENQETISIEEVRKRINDLMQERNLP